MERRVFIAILLCFVVLYGYQALFPPPPPPPVVESTQAVTSQAPDPPVSVDTEPVQELAGDQPQAVTTEEAEREIVVDTTTVQAVFTNRGGRVLHWRLKDHREKSGEVVDLVPTDVPSDQPRPFSLIVDDPALTARLNAVLYRVTGDIGGHVNGTARPAKVVFEFQDAAGLRVRKEFTFEPDGYRLSVSISATSGTERLSPEIAWGPGLSDAAASAGGGSFFTGNRTQPPEAIYYRDGDVERISSTSLAEQPAHEGTFGFAGIDDHYFIAAAVNPGQARIRYSALTLDGQGENNRALVTMAIGVANPDEGVTFYLGPKQFDVLQSIDPEFVRAINFGIFGFLSIWLLGALKWIFGFLGNYGWSIIALTLLINLVIAPLRHKSVVSMRKMQALQPRLKAIQDHYAGLKVTDPARQKMNTEIMALYREEGVNPASGCLPMIATMPILFAFYSLLSQAIELRGTEFVLWITDLSERDPYFVTPILMAASMFWQQRITPSHADPTQQKVMMMMPLMFGVMFLWVPSGLVLYWFVGNLCAIGQQYFTNWMIGPPITAVARPPAERRIKSAGAGRTAEAERKS
jgi:YidC/Oxa1 family membrane protein insertase